jgi:calcium homeostasis ER protein
MQSQSVVTKLEESNKGHQLLKKMGWSGAGLGSTEQGIQEPISAGEVRDASTLYKGIGMESKANDPFESYRRNRGQQFLERIVKTKDDKPK